MRIDPRSETPDELVVTIGARFQLREDLHALMRMDMGEGSMTGVRGTEGRRLHTLVNRKRPREKFTGPVVLRVIVGERSRVPALHCLRQRLIRRIGPTRSSA